MTDIIPIKATHRHGLLVVSMFLFLTTYEHLVNVQRKGHLNYIIEILCKLTAFVFGLALIIAHALKAAATVICIDCETKSYSSDY